MYQPKRAARSEFLPIRNLRYHVLSWGERRPGVPPLVMVHGWMDVAASFQFVVDAFEQDRYVIAPDLRGFGLTQMPDTDNWWEADYLGDLEFLFDHYAPDERIDLVGHSMGADVVLTYAGVRPHRIRKLVNLEGFGRPRTRPEQAPAHHAEWLDDLKSYHRGEKELTPYDSVHGVARRLMKTNRRLSREKAEWLARHWSRRDDNGEWRILGHAAYKVKRALHYQVDEEQALWRSVTAPVLSVEATEDSFTQWWGDRYQPAEYLERVKVITDFRRVVIEDAGHMLHHDQPERVAQLIEEFVQH